MIRLGTSSWTAEGWNRSFYPPRMQPRDYLGFYAQHFDTVEIDSTFYAIPAASTVTGWRERTPPDFLFAAKFPQAITHEKLLIDVEHETELFIERMRLLGDKLGPLLLQFRYFRQSEWSLGEFLTRLDPVLAMIPPDVRVAVEVRNKGWLTPQLTETLRSRGAALALIDHPYMPHARDYANWKCSLVTADFCYIRWLGDRVKTEELIARLSGEIVFTESILDRAAELGHWSTFLKQLEKDGLKLFGYFNNHFSGYAPTDVERIRALLSESD